MKTQLTRIEGSIYKRQNIPTGGVQRWQQWRAEKPLERLLVVLDANNETICEVVRDSDIKDTDYQHANLIAAAPDLLEACIQIVAALDDPGYDRDVRREVLFQRAHLLRELITKATGR